MSDDERREAAHQRATQRQRMGAAAYGTRWGTIDLPEDDEEADPA